MKTKVKQKKVKSKPLFVKGAEFEHFKIYNAWLILYRASPRLKPIHTHFFYYLLYLNNQTDFGKTFEYYSGAAKSSLGINKNTFTKILNDFVELKYLKIVRKATNQNTSNLISLTPLYKILSETLNPSLEYEQKAGQDLGGREVSLYDKLRDKIINEGLKEINDL